MARSRAFEFLRAHEPVGYLEQVAGHHVGSCLPFHRGVTFIGRQASACEFRDRESLAGMVEAAQVLLKVEGRRCWAADATSTNQTTLVRREHAGSLQAGMELRHESFETSYAARRWVEVFHGDLLVHAYGSWVVVIQ